MMRLKITILILVIPISKATHLKCLPFPVASECRMEYISYQPGDQISFPTGYQQFNIISPHSTKKVSSKVPIFDYELYEAMHRPSSIEMTRTKMERLTLPTELLLGDFSNNLLVSVNTPSPDNYQITYLDVSSNSLSNISFISRLVNLEVLHLESNVIRTVPGSALRPLTKLKYLYLQYNKFYAFPWNDLPRSMIHLDCSMGVIGSAKFTDLSLPSLEYLNLEYARISSLNVSDLLRAAPNLKEAHLYNSLLEGPEMGKIMAELTSNNVSFVEHYGWCTSDDDYEMISGNCVRRHPEDASFSTGKAVLFSAVVIGTAVLFVYILRLVFRHMNR